MLPPFIHIETFEKGTLEHEALPERVTFLAANDGMVPREMFDEYHDSRASYGMIEVRNLLSKAALQGGYATTYRDCLSELDAPLIKEMLRQIIQEMPSDYIDGSTILYLIYPLYFAAAMNKALFKLPLSSDSTATEQRIISAEYRGSTRAYQMQPYSMNLPSRNSSDTGWLFLHLFNPVTPTLVLSIPESGRLTSGDASLAIGHTSQVEMKAMETIERDLRSNGAKVVYVHEPNGHTSFPDFEADINETKWAIEITRVLEGIPKHRKVEVDAKDRKSMMDRAVRRAPIDHSHVESALNKALDSKRNKRRDCKVGEMYCLVLVNSINLDIGGTSSIWNGKDLTDFDTVILIHTSQQPTVEYIKGSLVDANAA